MKKPARKENVDVNFERDILLQISNGEYKILSKKRSNFPLLFSILKFKLVYLKLVHLRLVEVSTFEVGPFEVSVL